MRHVCLIAVAMRAIPWPTAQEWWAPLGGGILLVTLAVCHLWWARLGKGPVERVVAAVTDRIG